MGKSLLKAHNELAVIAKVEDLQGVEFTPFRNEEIVLFTSPDHPFAKKQGGIRFRELTDQPIIMRDEGSGTRRVIDEAFSRHKIKPFIVLETGNLECIKDMVANGEGISFLVYSSLKQDFQNKRLLRISIKDEKLSLPVQIAYLNNQPLSPAADAFLNFFVGGKEKHVSS